MWYENVHTHDIRHGLLEEWVSCEVANAGHCQRRRTRVQALFGGFREDLSEEMVLRELWKHVGAGEI